MKEQVIIKRTTGKDADFKLLISYLDNELWNELMEDQSTYDQYNKVPGIDTVIVAYADDKPVACGCFKQYDNVTVEIKRMYVDKACRGKGLSKLLLKELEAWAIESGFTAAILETSVHFIVARTLYETSGYIIIPNYAQYAGMKESVCMKKELVKVEPSPFFKLAGIEYFNFEEGFVEENVRCIPMIVRFKMDAAGIKLKLAEWNKFNVEERVELALKNCNSEEESNQYNSFLSGLIKKYTNTEATALPINHKPEWADVKNVPALLLEKIKNFDGVITEAQWKNLTDLQRFALIKLSREGHESKNLPKAMIEFKLK